LVGNRKGKIGVGVAKGPDVAIAVKKATTEAYKNVVEAPITDTLSIPYAITSCYKSSEVKLIPASSGTGLKA
jgi:small subunit ribosomal protein S5